MKSELLVYLMMPLKKT